MDRTLRTTLTVLAIIVLAALLFNLGIQLYWMFSGPAWGAYGPMIGPMMGGRGGMQTFGGFGFFGPILSLGLGVLLVAGIAALARSGHNERSEPSQPDGSKP